MLLARLVRHDYQNSVFWLETETDQRQVGEEKIVKRHYLKIQGEWLKGGPSLLACKKHSTKLQKESYVFICGFSLHPSILEMSCVNYVSPGFCHASDAPLDKDLGLIPSSGSRQSRDLPVDGKKLVITMTKLDHDPSTRKNNTRSEVPKKIKPFVWSVNDKKKKSTEFA